MYTEQNGVLLINTERKRLQCLPQLNIIYQKVIAPIKSQTGSR